MLIVLGTLRFCRRPAAIAAIIPQDREDCADSVRSLSHSTRHSARARCAGRNHRHRRGRVPTVASQQRVASIFRKVIKSTFGQFARRYENLRRSLPSREGSVTVARTGAVATPIVTGRRRSQPPATAGGWACGVSDNPDLDPGRRRRPGGGADVRRRAPHPDPGGAELTGWP